VINIKKKGHNYIDETALNSIFVRKMFEISFGAAIPSGQN
jgi:hypothetical protein